MGETKEFLDLPRKDLKSLNLRMKRMNRDWKMKRKKRKKRKRENLRNELSDSMEFRFDPSKRNRHWNWSMRLKRMKRERTL